MNLKNFIPNLLLALLHPYTVYAVRSLTVDTTSGLVRGSINHDTPNVAHFLGIPFAEPPIGQLRWLPSIPKARRDNIDATRFGPSCPQFYVNSSTFYPAEFNIRPNNTGEDCLSVNIWVPWATHRNSSELLPVIAWLYGGAFQNGGADIDYQIPSQWIQRSQKHIVVGINYRVNIFGFPNARGLNNSEQNLGLLDQRLGLEWIRKNIEHFGGNPERISLWGQSSGALSIDYYNFAYPKDPIVSGLIMDSGTATLDIINSYDAGHTNFSYVASHFGCGNLSAEAEIHCLRNVSSTDIIAFLKAEADAGVSPALVFSTVVDGRTNFANYTDRALAGNYSKKPAIIGTTTNEGVPFVPYNLTDGSDPVLTNQTTLIYFVCTAAKTTQDRYATGASTFRYLYGGNFSNISPLWWEGAYHQSELPLIFGTHGIARGQSTPFEIQVSHAMQDYWLAFAEDPVNGLPKLGWNPYEPTGNAVLLGWEGVVTQPIAENRLENQCDGLVPKPGALPPP